IGWVAAASCATPGDNRDDGDTSGAGGTSGTNATAGTTGSTTVGSGSTTTSTGTSSGSGTTATTGSGGSTGSTGSTPGSAGSCSFFVAAADPCAGVKAWDAMEVWNNYMPGDLRTHNGSLWSCHTPAWCQTEPGGANSDLGWDNKGMCAGGTGTTGA